MLDTGVLHYKRGKIVTDISIRDDRDGTVNCRNCPKLCSRKDRGDFYCGAVVAYNVIEKFELDQIWPGCPIVWEDE